jgi:uncharacterized protein DUF6894
MSRYYFAVTHDKDIFPDEEGMELDGIDAAWSEATKTCGEIMRNIDGSFKVGSSWSIKISDAANKVVRTISVTSTGEA